MIEAFERGFHIHPNRFERFADTIRKRGFMHVAFGVSSERAVGWPHFRHPHTAVSLEVIASDNRGCTRKYKEKLATASAGMAGEFDLNLLSPGDTQKRMYLTMNERMQMLLEHFPNADVFIEYGPDRHSISYKKFQPFVDAARAAGFKPYQRGENLDRREV